jgi:trans-aconitate methyltransferase
VVQGAVTAPIVTKSSKPRGGTHRHPAGLVLRRPEIRSSPMAIKPPSSRKSQAQLGLPLRPTKGERRVPSSGTDGNQPLKALLDRVWWSKGMRSLEVDCGSGERCEALHHRLRGDVTLGIDSSPTEIQYAKSHQTQELRFHCADPFEWTPQEPVDLILIHRPSGDSLSLLSLLDRIRPWLKEDGQLLIHSPRSQAHPLAEIIGGMTQSDPYRELFQERHIETDPIQPLQLSEHLHRLGFGRQWVDERVFAASLPTANRVLRTLMNTALPPLSIDSLDSDLSSFEKAAEDEIMRHCGSTPPFFWSSLHLLAWARLS